MTSQSSSLFRSRRVSTMCTVTVLHTEETLEAHVELDNDLLPTAGDCITVFGGPVSVEYGGHIQLRREAELARGTVADKLWTRMKQLFLLGELYEVSFSDRRVTPCP